MTSQHNPLAGQHPAADAQRQLQQIAALVDEYAELAEPHGNADLMILLLQIRIVLGDDPTQPVSGSAAGQRRPPRC